MEFFTSMMTMKKLQEIKKAADQERKIGEGSLIRQMKARSSGFHLPYQRTFSDIPLESYLGLFSDRLSIGTRFSIRNNEVGAVAE